MFDEMKGSKAWRTLGLGLACAAIAFSIAPRARAQSETIIYSPQGTNGDYAAPSVWAKDGSGNLYGVTWFAPDFGTVSSFHRPEVGGRKPLCTPFRVRLTARSQAD
jgi:hypothetical protein